MYLICFVLPFLSVTSVSDRVIDVADNITVTSQVAVLPEPVVAVIVALPGFTALTVPLRSEERR